MLRLLCIISIVALFILSLNVTANAVTPDEVLEDPALEARAREITRQLRCVVCQSQSIDDSDAPLAKDMRVLVRERVVAGDGEEEILAFMVERYGDYVLLKPPVQTNTIFLWSAPLVIFIIGGGLAWMFFARSKKELAQDHDTPSQP